jgi:homoserine O-succinyltransferase/O-acetyltransferase
MSFLLDIPRSNLGAANKRRRSDCINIGLINNMPDAAIESTEQQFIMLLRAAAKHAGVRLTLFAIPEVLRAGDARRQIAARYHDVSSLWNMSLDGLIVTGTEPRAANLQHEPYWSTLTKIIDWARENTISTIWSCLAAHAAVLRTDGIERRRLSDKMFGVFDCRIVADHPITQHLTTPLPIPHSRYNDLSERSLASCGYKILTRSSVAGVDTFAKQERTSLFLFFQGHPEYEGQQLLREYRRDIHRFLKQERKDYPTTPRGLFNAQASAIANEFYERACRDPPNSMIDDFPMHALQLGLQSPWRESAVAIYENWITNLGARKAEMRSVIVRRQPIERERIRKPNSELDRGQVAYAIPRRARPPRYRAAERL